VGFLDLFAVDHSVQASKVEAAVNVLPERDMFSMVPGVFTATSRAMAMSVPAFARARNIICGTIGSLPIKSYNKSTRERVYGNTLLVQPDPSLPRAVTIAWTVEDILLNGLAYWQILETDPVSGRPTRARRIEPQRISYTTENPISDIIDAFYLDGQLLPMTGVGSLIMFSSFDEGVLARAGQTINTAFDLETAARNMASDPAPMVVLKNTGIDLPNEQVTGLLSAWKQARRSKSTAYLNSSVDAQPFGFDPAAMQLVEARKFTTELISHLVGIPSYYLNADTSSNTYSNTIQERRNLVDYSLKPIISVIEQRLSMDDITPLTQEVRFDLDEYLRGNPLEQLEVIKGLMELQLIDQNEASAMLDLVPRGGQTA